MKKKLLLSALIAGTLVLSGCNLLDRLTSLIPGDESSETSSQGGSSGGSSSSQPVGPSRPWTILIYMCGSNLESGNGYDGYNDPINKPLGLASEDISEILSVNGQPSNVNIVLECGGAEGWANTQIKAHQNKLSRWTVENKKLVHQEDVNKVSMGASTTLQSFIEWGVQRYPSENIGLILWNHGGAMQGVCADENYSNNYLMNSEVKSAVSGAMTTLGMTGQKFEFIAYDACLMAVQDVAEFNSQYFKYMLCSQETEAGEGYEYTSWLDDLYAGKDTETVLKAAAKGFVDAYENKYGTWYSNDQTQSVLDLSKMAAYKAAFEDFASSAGSCINSYNNGDKSKFRDYLKQNVKTYANDKIEMSELEYEAAQYGETVQETIAWYQDNYDIFDYDPVTNAYIYGYGCDSFGTFDVADFLDEVGKLSAFSSLSGKIDTVKSALNDLVIYKYNGDEAGASNGLCLFFSTSSNCYKSYVYTASETNFTNWRTVVNTYGA